MRAIRFEAVGGPEVLRLVEAPEPAPGPGEVLIRQRAIGVNFLDVYQRSGVYPTPLPSRLGSEAAGIVEAVGEGVTRFAPGDRAAYCSGPLGAYADAHIVPAEKAVRLPDGVGFDLAAAALLKGLTARYLLRATHKVVPGDVIVVHAAAGGVGQILVQWGKHLGATVIAVAGSPEKAAIAERLGADHALVSSREDIAAAVRSLTGGEGADVVYDSVGKDTFEASLDCLAPLGLFVSFGNSSGPVPPFPPNVLAQKGSLFFTRPTLFTYVRTPALLDEAAADLFAVLASGAVRVEITRRWKLEHAADAHRALEARATTGSVILEP